MSDNVQIINALRTGASLEFQTRIPVATKTNMENILDTVMTYKQTKEEFTDLILNKIVKTVVMSKLYTNPYKFFKKGEMPFGKTIEAIFVDIIKAKSFKENFGESEASSLLGTEKPNLKLEYYSKNYEHKYKVTIKDVQLRTAFLNPNGLQNLIDELITSALTSAEYDEYLLIKSLLNTVKIKENVISGFEDLSENEQAKKLTKVLKTYIGYFGFLRKDYNTQEVHTHCKPKDIVILVTPETSAMVDVELLASSFNIGKAEIEGRMVLIDGFEKYATGDKGTMVADDDTLAIICDKDLVQFRESLNTSESFRNPDQLATNIFFHRHGSVSACGFVNAVKIKKA